VKENYPEAWNNLADEVLRGSEWGPWDFNFRVNDEGRIEARDVYPDPLVWNGKEWLQ
jgi:hypothetical protein